MNHTPYNRTLKPYTLVKTTYHHSVSMDLYHEFENRIMLRDQWDTANSIGSLQAKINAKLSKFFNPINIPTYKDKIYFIVGYQKEKFFPYFHYHAKLKALWMYDAWEPLYPDIENTIRRFGINLLFISNKQSVTYLNKLPLVNFKAYWIPEAIDPSLYKTKPFEERSIDILQLGRKWDAHHQSIKSLENELIYRYEAEKGQIIFKTREQFIEGLASTKISICVSSNITHPERTGNISTLTSRYLQSMASKCLILGKKPEETKELFNYDPIIEIDEQNPIAQIKEILSNYGFYMPLVEKNYQTVIDHHNWDVRIDQIENVLSKYL